MNIIIGILSGVLSSIFFICWGHRIYNKEIKIEHKLNPLSWIYIHSIVYFLTIMSMLLSDMLLNEFNKIASMPRGIKGITCLFIQNGGLIVLVMLLSSLLYNFYIKLCEFNYFAKRHAWIKKAFFSIVCISLVILYLVEIRRTQNVTNILSDEYKFVAVWMIVLIQIWIGFGMNFYSRDELSYRIKQGIEELKQKEERKYLLHCLLSMISVPAITIIYYIVKDLIVESVRGAISAFSFGIAFGAVLMIFTLFGWNWKYRPNKKMSNRRYKILFTNVQEEYSTEYYMDVRYELAKKGDEYILQIDEQKVILGDIESFSKEYIDELESAFDKYENSYTLQMYDEKEIYELIEKELLSRASKRKKLLKDGWSIVYKLCDEKEKMHNGLIDEKKLANS